MGLGAVAVSLARRTLLLLLVARSAIAQDYDSFVLAGQSNVLGASTQNEELFEGRVTSPNPDGLLSWSFRQADHRWTLANEFPCADQQCTGTDCSHPGPNRSTATHPRWTDQGSGTCVCSCGVHIPASNANADAARGSAWPTFARRWMEDRGRGVRFVATALGNQCLVASPDSIQPSWSPDAMDCSTLAPIPIDVPVPSISAPGELYCRMLESVQISGVANLRGVLWLQGECDASASVPFEEYESALIRLGDAVWADLGVPLIVAPISRHTLASDSCEEHPRLDGIHAATLEAAAEHPGILLGPNSDDLPLEADCTHIHDVTTLGDRWYATVSDVLPDCNDGLDNDGDGRIDFDGGAAANGGVPLGGLDPECATPSSGEHAAAGCGIGVELCLAVGALMRRRRRLV